MAKHSPSPPPLQHPALEPSGPAPIISTCYHRGAAGEPLAPQLGLQLASVPVRWALARRRSQLAQGRSQNQRKWQRLPAEAATLLVPQRSPTTSTQAGVRRNPSTRTLAGSPPYSLPPLRSPSSPQLRLPSSRGPRQPLLPGDLVLAKAALTRRLTTPAATMAVAVAWPTRALARPRRLARSA